MTLQDIALIREAAEWLYGNPKQADKLRALADRMEAPVEEVKPIQPDFYWIPCCPDAGYECESDSEIVFGKKLGDVFTLNEAYYFDAEFRVTKVPDDTDDTDDDYEVERISGTDLYTRPASAPAGVPDGWQEKILAEMSMRFALRGEENQSERLKYDDTQLGVEFALEQIALMLAPSQERRVK